MEDMNEEKVPDEEFRRDLTPIEEEILHYTEETSRQLAQKAHANELRKRFATPPPMKRIEIGPNPHLPELQFPEPPLLPKPGLTEADKEAMRQAISEGMKTFNEAVRKYGSLLQASNGRNNLQDLYEELLDACVYIRNEIERRRNEGA